MKFKLETWLVLGALAVAGYYGWKAFSSLKEKADKAIDATSTAIADAWLKLFPLPAAIELLGNVKFPGNIFVPLQKLTIRQDANHNVFTKYADHLWQLQPRNESGNWPAVLVK
jgi:hypothetical protein